MAKKGLRKQLIGARKLASYVETPLDGSPKRFLMGESAQGILMYTPDGYMSAQLMTPGRRQFASGDSRRPRNLIGRKLMSRTVKVLLPVLLATLFAVNSSAQAPTPPQQTVKSDEVGQKTKKKATKEPSERLEAMQGKLDQAQAEIQQQQTEIERLQKSLQDSVAALQEQQKQLWVSIQRASDEAGAARDTATLTGAHFVNISSSSKSSNDSLPVQDDREKNHENPTAIYFKGLTLTPGGFLDATTVVRTRNENSDIANTYNTVPLNGSPNAKLTEFRGSARNSRLSLMLQGNAGSSNLTGYFEMDFLGSAPTANFLETSSFTPRVRQAWLQIGMNSGWTIAGGQTWSLLTLNRHGIAPKAEWFPDGADANYVVGYNWTRGRNFRVTKNFHDKIWAAFEIDDPENTVSAAFVPPNVMGLNTSPNTQAGGSLLLPFLQNYSFGNSTTVAPDLMGKVAFEPGWGHFEIKALGRFFRDRVASTATTNGHTNINEGYGVGFGAILPVFKKVDFIAEGLIGQGIGRYASGQLPDVTLNPANAAMRPLREAHLLGGVEYRVNNRLKFYGYGGTEYAGRYAYTAVNSSGVAVPGGYGSPLVSYAACTNEVALNSCSGANRDMYEATAGYWYRLYQGEFGWLQYGNQVAYIHRSLWNGIGRTPQGEDIVVYSTVRFYLP